MKTSTSESFRSEIHQTVHGYSDGHRLLASSSRLSKDVERLLLLLSDLSGPGGDPFDPYLTGYPIESIGCYALARTWPAAEMDRPGCVWTHTILIGDKLLEQVERPEILLSLFRRPLVDSAFSDYLEAVPFPSEVEMTQQNSLNQDEVTESLAAALINALYSDLTPHTVLTVPRYSLAERPFLAIWGLQWPQLRQRFTFCSGSRAPRSLSGEPFFLQAALERDLRRFTRSQVQPKVVPWQVTSPTVLDEWIQDATAACVDHENSSLPAFMVRIGRDLPAESMLFRPVVQAHSILSHSSGADAIADLIDFTAEEFPKAEMGRAYKEAFFNAGNPAGFPDLAILRGLATAARSEAFDSVEFHIRSRSASLWSSGKDAWDLLIQLLCASRNSLADEVMSGLCTSMPLRFLRPALDATPELFADIISYNPALACSAELWKAPLAYQTRAVASLMICRDSVVSLSDDIIRAALEANADPTNPSLVDLFGSRAVVTILDWLSTNPQRAIQLPAGWRLELSNHSIQMLEWLDSHSSVRPEITDLILAVFKLETVLAHPLVVSAFAKHIPPAGEAADDILTLLAVRVLRLALSMPSPEAVVLASASLDTVYHATEASRLSEEAWRELSPFLPEGYWWQDWDRCYRLRKGIAEKFRSEQWPATRLVSVTRNDDLFGAIVAELSDRWSGRRVLATAAESSVPGTRRELMQSEC